MNNLPQLRMLVEKSIEYDINSSFIDFLTFKSLIINRSKYGDIVNYRLSLVFEKNNNIPLGDLEISLFNSSDSNIQEIPVVIEYHFPILKHFQSYNLNDFSFEEIAFFNLFFSVFEVDAIQIIKTYLMQKFPGAEGLNNFITAYNNSNETTFSLSTTHANVEDLYSQIENDFQLFFFEGIQLVQENGNDVLNVLFEVASEQLGIVGKGDILKFILPTIRIIVLDVNISLLFPRRWILPLDDQNKVIDESNDIPDSQKTKTSLTFNVGSLSYSTTKGLIFTGTNSINFQKSQIGNTGLILEINNAKIDLSENSNIKEAQEYGLSDNFKGVYVEETIIILPPKWFSAEDDDQQTLALKGQRLLIGTGGFSGLISLVGISLEEADENEDEEETPDEEADDNAPEEFIVNFGKDGSSSKFQIGFQEFTLDFDRNSIITSSILGSITIPNFKAAKRIGDSDWEVLESELRVDISMLFDEDGDFTISAQPTTTFEDDNGQDQPIGLSFCIPNVFVFTIKNLEVGKDNDKAFLCFSGSINFEVNNILSEIITGPIEVEDFCVYSDGSFEIAGGSIALPDTVGLNIGPTEIYINALHIGSHEQVHDGVLRKYKYFGLDAGVNVNPGGVEANGNGIKYYFTTDDLGEFHHFLRLESLQIDLQFPGDVDPSKAALIASGFLSIDGPEYTGSIKFSLPKVKIAGGAGMKYNKLYPAFLIDAFVEIPTAIPLGNTGLGIYGFRGLFGLRYIASLDAVDPPAENWLDYYNADPDKGIHVAKFKTPDGTSGSSSPMSIGAGISLATSVDDGKAFSSQLFLLLSLRNTILLEGKANFMGERVGITSGNPPFYAMLNLTVGESILLEIGADYNIPTPEEDPDKAGKIMELDAEVQGGFFFSNTGAWYLNFGTKDAPISAKVLTLFDCYAYLMISAKRIAAGAGYRFELKKKYGPARAEVDVYFDIWGELSFERATIGGGLAVGGGVDVSFFGVGFFFSIDTILEVIAPAPFKISGSVEICVGVNLVLKRVEKCFRIQFEFPNPNKQVDAPGVAAIFALPLPEHEPDDIPVKAIHMVSGQEYKVKYSGTYEINAANRSELDDFVIPVDSWIDIDFRKPVIPSEDLDSLIIGRPSVINGYREIIPPSGDKNEKHEYHLLNMELEYYEDGTWQAYNPFEKIIPDYNSENHHSHIGQWQPKGLECKQMRLLADSPFSYANAGQENWYNPGAMGMAGSTLFCKAEERSKTCIHWKNSRSQLFRQNRMYADNGLSFMCKNTRGELGKLLSCERKIQDGILIDNGGIISIYFYKEVRESIELCLGTTNDQGFRINYYSHTFEENRKVYTQEGTERVYPDCYQKVIVDFPQDTRISRVDIISYKCDPKEVESLTKEIEYLENKIEFTSDFEELINLYSQQEVLKEKILSYKLKYCKAINGHREEYHDEKKCELELIQVNKEINELQELIIKYKCDIKKPDERCKRILGELKKLIELSKSIYKTHKDCIEHRTRLECKSILYSLCYLKEEDYYYNQSISSDTAIAENFTLLSQDEEYDIKQVIWKPDTYFRVKITLEDRYQGFDNGSGELSEVFYFGFKSGKPIGHFSLEDLSLGYFNSRSINDSEELVLHQKNEDTNEYEFNRIDVFGNLLTDGGEIINLENIKGINNIPITPENNLKPYLDYSKSYPNADGDLLYAKPLYYKDPYANSNVFNAGVPQEVQEAQNAPTVLLFFKQDINYAEFFFKNWETLENTMEILIIDPTENLDNEVRSDADFQEISVAEYFETIDDESAAPNGYTPSPSTRYLEALANAESEDCTQGVQLVPPPLSYLRINMVNLLPNKLYNVIIKNNYEGTSNAVHSFNFKTSRYPNFHEHISSYIIDEDSDLKALFNIPIPGITNVNIEECWTILTNNLVGTDLDLKYPDDFDKLIYGKLGISIMPPPETVEINLLKNGDGEDAQVFGIWLRSPEPINDPKISLSDLIDHSVVQLNDGNGPDFKYLKSKDSTQLFLMREDADHYFEENNLVLNLKYIEPTKNDYQEVATTNCLIFENTVEPFVPSNEFEFSNDIVIPPSRLVPDYSNYIRLTNNQNEEE
jgi:hypothetical protein